MTKVYLTTEGLSLPDDGQHVKALLHWVSQAEKKLWAEEPPYPVTDEGRMGISLLLLKRVETLAIPTLDALLNDRLRACNPVLRLDIRLATREERAAASKALYKQLLEEEMWPLFQKSPLLAGYLDQGSEQFVGMIRELLAAVAENREAIERELTGGPLGAVTDLQCNSSDFHFHGRCTVTVSTEHGRFVYKPHDCRCDAAFGELVERWFSDITRAPRCLARDGYGFCEFIHSQPATTREEAKGFFENFGGLCAVFQALGSTDLHYENFVAVGTRPVLVDLETVLTPVSRIFNDPEIYPDVGGKQDGFISDVNRSLLPSALLPKRMGREQSSVLFNTEECVLPVVDGKKESVKEYEPEFFKGFSDLYDRCIKIRPELLRAVDGFRRLPVRKLMRQTDFYFRLLQTLYTPAALACAETQQAVLKGLGDYFIRHGAPQLAPVAAWEAQCLLEGDIPYFSALGGGLDLLGYGQAVLPGFFAESAVDNAKTRIMRLNEREKAFETAILKRSFASALIPAGQGKASRPAPHEKAMLLTDEAAVKEAEEMFRRIREDCVEAPGGERSWLACTGDSHLFSVMQPVLFQGSAGLGLFFAAVAAASVHEETAEQARGYAGLCLRQIAGACRQLRAARKIPEEWFPLGLSSGFGGVLRSLVLMGRYLRDETALQTARELLGLLRKDQILSAVQTDQISGTAGLLAAVSGVEELRETEAGRRVIRWCSEQLLEKKRLPDGTGGTLWDSFGAGRPISGMGHGTAGIGHALMRAASLLESDECRRAGMDAMKFEHRAYKEQLGTWPDLRDSAHSSGIMHGFCSGAPGIGLAMLDAAQAGDRPPVLAENLDRALEACGRMALLPRDHLCCGNSAAVDFYIEYARRSGDSAYHEKARVILSKMVARKAVLGDYTYLPSAYRPIFSTTLFYGGAGVGYELLRLAYPDRIMSVLI